MSQKVKENPEVVINRAFETFKEEAENFFVTKFITSPTLILEYKECLDIVFNISEDVDATKGIIAYNPNYGQGKSFFFEVLNSLTYRKFGRRIFKIVKARDLCDIYTNCKEGQDPIKLLTETIRVKNLVIDDIGDELRDGAIRNNYGNKLNVIRFVLLKRHDWYLDPSKRWRTFGTTNLPIEGIGKHYDGRVADRLLQMTYYREFKFLSKGSFRQVKDSRKLTPQEIDEKRRKFLKKKVEEEFKIDEVAYFNDLINEDDEYFKNQTSQFWNYVKQFLITKKMLTEKDFDEINEEKLDKGREQYEYEVQSSTRTQYKHTKHFVRSELVRRAVESITRGEVYNYCENQVAKKKFFELRKKKHIFI